MALPLLGERRKTVYTIKKAAHIVDELKIEDGNDSLVLNVNIYVDDILADFEEKRAAIGKAQSDLKALKASKEADPSQIGVVLNSLNDATYALFELIFGKEQTEQLVSYYNNRALTMLADFLPYFTGVILPEIKKAQADLADKYKSWNAR